MQIVNVDWSISSWNAGSQMWPQQYMGTQAAKEVVEDKLENLPVQQTPSDASHHGGLAGRTLKSVKWESY